MTINRNLSILAGGVSSTGVLGVPNGGSGATTLTGYLIGNGAGAFTASTTIPTSALSGTVNLTSQVSGILPIANGGTAQSSFTAGQIHYGSFSTSANLFFNGTQLGVGTSSPSSTLTVNGTFYTGGASQQLGIYQDGTGMAIEAWLTGTTSTKKNFWLAAYGGQVAVATNTPYASSALTVNGPIAQAGSAGSYTIDVTNNSTTVAASGTVNFSNFSGMIIVNSSTTGFITIYLAGGGVTSNVSSLGGTVGTLTYNAGINGYTWTNSSVLASTVVFFCVRTRTNA